MQIGRGVNTYANSVGSVIRRVLVELLYRDRSIGEDGGDDRDMAGVTRPPGNIAHVRCRRLAPAAHRVISPLACVTLENIPAEVLEEFPVSDVIGAVSVNLGPGRAECVVPDAAVDGPVAGSAVSVYASRSRAHGVREGIAVGVEAAPAPRAALVVRRRGFSVWPRLAPAL